MKGLIWFYFKVNMQESAFGAKNLPLSLPSVALQDFKAAALPYSYCVSLHVLLVRSWRISCSKIIRYLTNSLLHCNWSSSLEHCYANVCLCFCLNLLEPICRALNHSSTRVFCCMNNLHNETWALNVHQSPHLFVTSIHHQTHINTDRIFMQWNSCLIHYMSNYLHRLQTSHFFWNTWVIF